MAENAPTAFGKYLRALRERRGLSLQDVVSLSRSSVEPVTKGYLSRCENGRQKLAFAKVISLSHLYEVPADVLVERMELDLELDRIGGPETAGLDLRELTRIGRECLQSGRRWHAYAVLRDACFVSDEVLLDDSFGSMAEQRAVSWMNLATAAHALRRHQIALFEFTQAKMSGALADKYYAMVLERIATVYRGLKSLDLARDYSDRAIAAAESHEDQEYLGYYYTARGLIAYDEEDFPTALRMYQHAYERYKLQRDSASRALVLNNIAQTYFSSGRSGAARSAAEAALEISSSSGFRRIQALSQILLGEIDEAGERRRSALERWKRATAIAKELEDSELRFKAEFFLFRNAYRSGNLAVARSIGRRLRRLSPWVPSGTVELAEFKTLKEELDTSA